MQEKEEKKCQYASLWEKKKKTALCIVKKKGNRERGAHSSCLERKEKKKRATLDSSNHGKRKKRVAGKKGEEASKILWMKRERGKVRRRNLLPSWTKGYRRESLPNLGTGGGREDSSLSQGRGRGKRKKLHYWGFLEGESKELGKKGVWMVLWRGEARAKGEAGGGGRANEPDTSEEGREKKKRGVSGL